jgi:hypothetical protein
MHKNPIASVHHLPGNLGITGFIRIPEIPSTYSQYEDKEAETQEDEYFDPVLLE